MLRWYYHDPSDCYFSLDDSEFGKWPYDGDLIDVGTCTNPNNKEEGRKLHQELIKKHMENQSAVKTDKFGNRLFIDVFCPTKLANFVLPARIKKRFADGVHGHLLLGGNPGLGKSSLLRILLDANNIPYYYINASESGGIDTLRGEIEAFCTQVQLVLADGNQKASDVKYVYFDEIDGASQSFFNALKGFMDIYSKNVRFAATTNHYNKIPPAIKSRFEYVTFDFMNSSEEQEVLTSYKARVKAIITKSLEMTIDDNAFEALINKNFPDFRGVLQDLERLYRSGIKKITLDEFTTKSYQFKDLFELIINSATPEENYKKIMGKYASNAHDVMDAFHHDFIGYIEQSHPTLIKAIPYLVHTIWEHQKSLPDVIDPAIAVESCSFKMIGIIQQAKK